MSNAIRPPERLETERLRMRRPEVAMADAIFRAIDADRARLQTWLPWVRGIQSAADEEAFIVESARDWQARTRFAYGLQAKAGGAYLGNCGFVKLEWEHRYAEIGYWVTAAAQGRGYVTEACRALEHAARGMGLHRLEIHCATRNARSAAVPERLGYVLEGVCREDFFADDRYYDTAIYGKLLV